MVSSDARARVMALFRRTPLRTAYRWYRYSVDFVRDPAFRRRERAARQRFRLWKRTHAPVLRVSLRETDGPAPVALVVSKGTMNGAEIELGLIKGLDLAGYEPVVLTERRYVRIYRLAGVRRFLFWEDVVDRRDRRAAVEAMAGVHSVEDLLAVRYQGNRIGRFAASAAFRSRLAGHLDLADPDTRHTVREHLALSATRAAAAHRILARLRPAVALLLGNRYAGQSELLDTCIAAQVDVVTWFEAHRSNTLMLKRYHRQNRDQHHASLSDASWRLVRRLEWTGARREELRRELADHYASGDWYGRGGTQFDRPVVDASALRARLALDPGRKTAVVFPHIVWDATLFWGRDLFAHYEEWLVETIKAACANPAVNWVIKIHPAHTVKNAWSGHAGEPAEEAIVRAHVGRLPPHVSMIPAATDINTFSLFGLMDYCLTVRGTIGIEAASFGIPTLTAGSGRYDRRGFTVDAETRAEYLDRLARIQEVPRLTPAQRELAERFAYGAFLLRPLALRALSIEYERDATASMRVRLHAATPEDLRQAPDLRAFADWVAHSTDEDYLERSRLADAPDARPDARHRHADRAYA